MYQNTLDSENMEFTRTLELMENTQEHLFITGEAGTGKSTLLKHFVANTTKDVVVLAPTGLAAINARGQTIHKFCLLPPRFVRPEDVQTAKNPQQRKMIEGIQTIIIDEISMVRADQMDAIDRFLRLNRKKNMPFGGVQMIFVGDLFQLPPVVRPDEASFFTQLYLSPYFFSSVAFNDLDIHYLELRKNYRQEGEHEFLRILNRVKKGQIDADLLTSINERFLPIPQNDHDLYIHLASTNQIALEINSTKLAQLPDKEFKYDAEIVGDFQERDCPAETTLQLKKGAQIMFVRNDNMGRWVNGSMGVIEDLGLLKIKVRMGTGQVHEVEKEKWENLRFVFNEDENRVESKVVGSMKQYPLKLAWAVTIHKSQGQTFDKVLIDLGRGAFSHGQTYVALSRARKLEGIRLKRKIFASDFIVDKRVVEFMSGAGWE
jgi:energy-coupling factor transporter ATP-binding protein EcfA2